MIPNAEHVGTVHKRNGAWLCELTNPNDTVTPIDQFDCAGTLRVAKQVLAQLAELDDRSVDLWARNDDGDYEAFQHNGSWT